MGGYVPKKQTDQEPARGGDETPISSDARRDECASFGLHYRVSHFDDEL